MIDPTYIEGLKTGLWLGFVAGVGAGLAWAGLRAWWKRGGAALAQDFLHDRDATDSHDRSG